MSKIYLEKLIRGHSLTQDESYLLGLNLLEVSNREQIAAILALLRAKKETVEELLGFVRAIKEKSISISFDQPILDIVGTGGDGLGTINISTASALLASACGALVVKHGNRAVSSQCGSADVLEALGFDIHMSSERLKKSVSKTGFGFCFAPDYHPALKILRTLRKSLGVPTFLHFLGPLLNPAGLQHMLIGVYDADLVSIMAEMLFRLGTKRSFVFHGHGMDELSCIGPMSGILVTEMGMQKMTIDPEKLGLQTCTLEDLKGFDAKTNAMLIRKALSPEKTPLTDTLILNAGMALYLYQNLESLEEGIIKARMRLQEGSILPKNYLQEIILRKKREQPRRKSLKKALLSQAASVIGEIKRASPSKGEITRINHPGQRALEYIQAGIVAISVLCDGEFQGSMQDLKEVSLVLKESEIPILCKDFLVTPYQIAEAAAHGADAILLIVAALREKTAEMVQIAQSLGLETLVEIHNEEELIIALEAKADLIGVNQRDLTDFSLHPERFAKLIKLMPKEQIVVAESGIQTYAEAGELFQMGYQAVLVGEALSKDVFFGEAYAH